METVCFIRTMLICNDVLELCVRAASRERSRWRICPRWYRSFTLITNSTFSFTCSTIFSLPFPLSHPLNNMWYSDPVLFYHICSLLVPAREIKWPQVNKYVRDNLHANPNGRKAPQKTLYRPFVSFCIINCIEFNTEGIFQNIKCDYLVTNYRKLSVKREWSGQENT